MLASAGGGKRVGGQSEHGMRQRILLQVVLAVAVCWEASAGVSSVEHCIVLS